MSIIKNDGDITSPKIKKNSIYELPAVARKDNEEISFEKALIIAFILHPLVVLIFFFGCLIMTYFGFDLFKKPDMKPKDIEFVLVEKEAPPIDKNTRIVDTPGFSNLKFDFLLPQDVDSLFVEMVPYKGLCKFQNCLHINETDCAIKSHLGEIDITRYESYLAFVEEAKDYKEKLSTQGHKKESGYKLFNEKKVAKISTKHREKSRNVEKQTIKTKEETNE
jgi:hypothetical protein